MAEETIQEIETGSSCYDCLSNWKTSKLFLLDQIRILLGGDVMTIQEIETASSCYDCLSNPITASLVLENAILAASGGGGTSDFTYTRSAVNPVAAPPTANAQHYNTVTQALWQWDGAAWV